MIQINNFEKHFCQCGCNQEIVWRKMYKYIGWAKFLNHHSSHLRKGKTVLEIYGKKIKIKKPLEKRVCKCGCNESFLVKSWLNKKYIFGHYASVQIQKGKSKEEFYGKEKAEKMIESSSKRQKGKSWVERYGKEIAEKRRKNFIEKLVPYAGRTGKNEEIILKDIEKSNNIVLERQYYICGYYVDGYDKNNNVVYEVDEWHHKRRKSKLFDIQREEKIKKELNCQIVRINEEEYLNKKYNQILVI